MENYTFTTWCTRYSCKPELYFQPSSIEELREILGRAREKGRRVKVCGSHHSLNDLACTSEYMVDLQKFNGVLDVDSEKHTIRVEAGITLKQLNEDILPKHNLGLSVMGVISEQTLAGAISTCTHGTGVRFGMMSTYILDLDIMTASGEVLRCSKDENPDLFSAARCGLGALGIIVSATIQCEPAFKLHETITPMKFDHVLANLDEYACSADHVTFMWVPHTDCMLVSKANRSDRPMTPPRAPSWFWDILVGYHAFQTAFYISDVFESLVPWINSAFRKLFFPRSIERVDTSHRVFTLFIPLQLANEWAVPRDQALEVLRELKERCDRGELYAHPMVTVRFVKADDVMLSPSYNRDVCYLNFVHNMPYGSKSSNVKCWNAIQDIAQRVNGCRHWGKTDKPFGGAAYRKLFPLWDKFCSIRQKMDPDGVFMNDFLEKCFDE